MKINKDITFDYLESLGFVKEISSPEESGEPDGFYYYTYEIEGECVLISDANNENDGNFTISFFQHNVIELTDIDDLLVLVRILLKYKLKWTKIN